MKLGQKDVSRVIDYIEGCNIDFEVALEDLGLPPNSMQESELPQLFRRCVNCNTWFFADRRTQVSCDEC